MDYPRYDPHGDPIPDSNGNIKKHQLVAIATVTINTKGIISGVRDHSAAFLQYLDKQNLTIGKVITVTETIDYDHSMIIKTDYGTIHISRDVANNLLVSL
jgi:DtxR family Mn-dependent transcriptional regulator